jgi:hypothetical protein
MLAEGAHCLALRDCHALRAHAGIAPVTKQSGKSRQVLMRYRCNQRLRNAFYHWARTSIQHDPRSKQHYTRLRQVGHNHGRALRGVADRLLAVLIAMPRTGKTYDPNRRSVADVTPIGAGFVHAITARRLTAYLPSSSRSRWKGYGHCSRC